MTDVKIKKALECCKYEYDTKCELCSYNVYSRTGCRSELRRNALDLINRQQAEIERLNGCVKTEDEVRTIAKEVIDSGVKQIKAEAIKEFAKAYKDQIKNYTGMFTDEGFYVSHEAVLDAVDFVLDKKLEEIMGGVEWQ